MSSDSEFTDVVRFLSLERLATFKAITGSIDEAISLHQQTLRLGAQLMMVTAVIEVALRNTVYEKLESFYGQPDWLVSPPPGLLWMPSETSKIKLAKRNARRGVYAKMSQAEKRHLDTLAFPEGALAKTRKITYQHKVVARQAQITVTIGQIVAQLTFFFWKRLYSKDYANVLWTPLKTVFPDRSLKRAEIATQLEHLYQSRNRVAHHEPIFGRRLRETLGAVEFFLNHFDGKDTNGVAHISKLLIDDWVCLQELAHELESRIASFRVGVES